MLVSALAALASVALASSDRPLQDDLLQQLDHDLFGFDWNWVISISRNCPKVLLILSYAYASIGKQPFVLLGLLFSFGLHRTARTFRVAWAVALAITVGVSPLVPAVGGYLHNHVQRDQTHVLVAAAWRHAEILLPARDGTLRTLGTAALEGIITFPSFHAAASVLLAWGFWHLRYVRWPALALNGVMLASTPFIGGHYIVDVVAGCAIAAAALLVTRQWSRGCRGRGLPRGEAGPGRYDPASAGLRK